MMRLHSQVRYAANPLDYRKMIVQRSVQKDWRPRDPRRVLPRMRQYTPGANR
jgi:hypothetical protein